MRPTKRELRPFSGLRKVIASLRGPGGCPWDRVQTHESLRPFLLEEASETLEALDGGDPAQLCEELGDLLLEGLLPAPALARAQAIQRRASRAGFAWESAGQAWDALEEELRELREAATPEEQRDELGDALVGLAGLARWLEVDAGDGLRA